MLRTRSLLNAAIAGALTITSAYAQDKTPGFNHKIPEKIMTPDKVETRIGTLNFVDGVPTAETTQKVYDNLDLPARRGGLPQLHPCHFPRSDPAGQGRTRRDQEQPGGHLRPTDGLQSALPHRQHRHRLLHRPSSTWRRMGRPWSRFRPAAARARWTTPSSASSSTWARPDRTRARAAST